MCQSHANNSATSSFLFQEIGFATLLSASCRKPLQMKPWDAWHIGLPVAAWTICRILSNIATNTCVCVCEPWPYLTYTHSPRTMVETRGKLEDLAISNLVPSSQTGHRSSSHTSHPLPVDGSKLGHIYPRCLGRSRCCHKMLIINIVKTLNPCAAGSLHTLDLTC